MKLTSSQRERDGHPDQGRHRREGPYFDFSYEHIVGSGRRLARGARHRLPRHPAAPPARCPGGARGGRQGLRRARGRGQGARTSASRTTRPARWTCCASTSTQPIVANQVQLSVTHAPLIAQGMANNMQGAGPVDRRATTASSTTAACTTSRLQAWSPFQAGFFTGPFLGNPEYAELNAVIDRLAAKYDVPRARDRDRVDHASPRQVAGGHRHHDAGARRRGRAGLRDPAHARRVVRDVQGSRLQGSLARHSHADTARAAPLARPLLCDTGSR